MLDPLSSYLTKIYLKYYVLSLAFMCPFAIVGLRDARLTYVALVPVSLATTLALCVTVYELARRTELETLQSLGVPFRRFAAPLLIVSFGPLTVGSAFAIAVAKDTGFASLCASLALSGMALAFAIILIRVWRTRDPGAAAACALGFAAQTGLAASALTLAAFLQRAS